MPIMICSKCNCPVNAHKHNTCPPDYDKALFKVTRNLGGPFGFTPERMLNVNAMIKDGSPLILIPGQVFEINGYLIVNKRPLEDTATKLYISGDAIVIKSEQPVDISIRRVV